MYILEYNAEFGIHKGYKILLAKDFHEAVEKAAKFLKDSKFLSCEYRIIGDNHKPFQPI